MNNFKQTRLKALGLQTKIGDQKLIFVGYFVGPISGSLTNGLMGGTENICHTD